MHPICFVTSHSSGRLHGYTDSRKAGKILISFLGRVSCEIDLTYWQRKIWNLNFTALPSSIPCLLPLSPFSLYPLGEQSRGPLKSSECIGGPLLYILANKWIEISGGHQHPLEKANGLTSSLTTFFLDLLRLLSMVPWSLNGSIFCRKPWVLLVNWEDNLEDPRGLLVHASHFTEKEIQALRRKMNDPRLHDLVELFIAYPTSISCSLFLPSRTSILLDIEQEWFQRRYNLPFSVPREWILISLSQS